MKLKGIHRVRFRKKVIGLLKSKGIDRIDGKTLGTTSNKILNDRCIEIFGSLPNMKDKKIKSIQQGFIYFIGNDYYGFCKIGFSKHPEKRLSQIQTGCPFALRIFSIIDGNIENEKEYHRKYQSLKTYGEWFKIEYKLKDYLKPFLDAPQFERVSITV